MKALSLFTGIGGFDLAAERAGAEVVAHSETDSACQKLLVKKFLAARQLGDVTQITEEAYRGLGAIDLVTAGWPCQDLSVAGNRAGLAGARSGLWSEVVRALAILYPLWFVGENVPGLLSSKGGRDFGTALGALAELGYGWAYRVLDARYFGVAQRRRRVFIVGSLGDGTSAAEVLFEPEGGEWHPASRREAREGVANALETRAPGARWHEGDTWVTSPLSATHARTGTDADSGGDQLVTYALNGALSPRLDSESETFVVADTVRSHPRPGSNSLGQVAPMLGGGNYGQGNLDEGVPMVVGVHANQRGEARTSPLAGSLNGQPSGKQYEGVMAAQAVRRLTPVECERLQGFPDGWTEGFSDSIRYRMLGNAICVNVAEWVLRRVTLSSPSRELDRKEGR